MICSLNKQVLLQKEVLLYFQFKLLFFNANAYHSVTAPSVIPSEFLL